MEGQRYLISILPSVYSKPWSQDESQEEPVFSLARHYRSTPQTVGHTGALWTQGKQPFYSNMSEVSYQLWNPWLQTETDSREDKGELGVGVEWNTSS